MIKWCRAMTVKVGRRGSFLIFLALLDFLYGFALITQANPVTAQAELFPSVVVWGVAWMVVGAVCLVQAFATLDRLAYSLAVLIKFLWGMEMLLVWVFTNTNPHGWISAVIFLSFGLLTSIVSFWPEQRRFRIEDK